MRSIGHAILPVELFALIGEFLAGSNTYATLGNFSLTCRVLYYELQPILFETVIVSETDRKWREKVSDDPSLRRWFRNTRYLITENSTWDKWNHETFPNLHVVIHKKPMTPPEEAQQLRSVSIELHKSVHIDTLSALLQIPVFWKPHRYDYTSRYPVGRVKAIKIHDNVLIDGLLDPSEDFVDAAKYSGFHVEFDFKHRQVWEEEQDEFGMTISNVLWLVMSVESLRREDQGIVGGRTAMATFDFFMNGGLPVAEHVVDSVAELFEWGFFPNVSMDLRQRKVSTHDLEESMMKAGETIHRYYRQMVQNRADDDFWIMAFLAIRCGGKGQGATIGRLMPHHLPAQFVMQTCSVVDVDDGLEIEEVASTQVLSVDEYVARARVERARSMALLEVRRRERDLGIGRFFDR
ncbi:hypothetical protein QFC21_006072 [Naganishia friedmannii]|uniref:Uncharacterized protein n=1 Tax=Naganishia friedmannii TaxID=89922 RepID=A0ACC2V5W6_9TREE|nr:hypothetical protein QFC21_006072 [Naganishia friedmannii]